MERSLERQVADLLCEAERALRGDHTRSKDALARDLIASCLRLHYLASLREAELPWFVPPPRALPDE